MAELLAQLESNDKEVVENAKQKLRDQLKTVTESWLVNGLYEFYLNTNSVHVMDILINVKEPHHNYLFEKLCDSIKTSKTEAKVQALTLLGHIARSQPTWLYKLPEHTLLRDILKLLKNEGDLLPLISALLVLIVLLPMIPSSMGDYLKDVFEIFSRLASWNCSPGKFVEDQMIHMQVALYALFLRLYGMYPCNFLYYLRTQYKDNNPVFVHTIKPMLDTVRMHPSLVTASKDNETTMERWKKLDAHDVIVECERFSLDLTDRCPHDHCQIPSGFRSRSGTTNSTIEPSYQLQALKNLSSAVPSSENTFFSPGKAYHVQAPPVTETAPTNIPQPHIQGVIQSSNFSTQEGTSPPEAAIEATPETTPIRDLRSMPGRIPPINSGVARALTSFTSKSTTNSLNTTPTHSQPSSPMHKDKFVFHQTAINIPKRDSYPNQKLQRLMQDRSQLVETLSLEDKEVVDIVSQSSEYTKVTPLRHCDSVLHENEDGDENLEEQEHGSPCTAGGLHMPNSISINNFAKRVKRLRIMSECNTESERAEISTGSSPGNCIPFANNTTVRRANSCPEIKKSPVVPTKDNISKPFNETDEEVAGDHHEISLNNSNGMESKISQPPKNRKPITCSTQTENFWPMPYEHLFLGILPSLDSEIKPSPIPSPAPLNFSQEKYFSTSSIYDTLDKYIEKAVMHSEKDTVQNLKDQLQLLHQQLLFERHRRETHAYRNRRLLSDAKNTRLLEEYNSALRDQVELQERDIEKLRTQLETFKKERLEEDKKLSNTMQYWQNQCKTLQEDCKHLKETNDTLSKELIEINNKCTTLDSKRQEAESSLLDAFAEVNVAREQAWAGEKGRTELEQVHKELLLIGELQIKYQERLNDLSSMKKWEEELRHLKEVYNHEIKTLNHQLESKITSLEACRSRISELEHGIIQHEELISTQKQVLNDVKKEHHEKLEAVESKYQTQLKINRALEEKILDLRQKVEVTMKTSVNSPDTSSCHEVNVTTTDRTAGLSPHSSPLSASLASSEGSMAFHDVREVKNLQAFVDQKEPNLKSKQTDETNEMSTDDLQPSSSKHD